MKKIYMKPEMELFNMKMESLICLSGSEKAADPTKPALAKELDDFIDDESIEFLNWHW